MFEILLFFQNGRSIEMQFVLDILQVIFWVGTLLAAVWTLRKGLIELEDSRKLRKRELREKQAAMALDFTNKFDADDEVQTILQLFDYGILQVKFQKARTDKSDANEVDTDEIDIEINTQFFISSLQPKSQIMAPYEFEFRSKYIVKLLNYFESFEHFIQAELMIEEDVTYRVEYFVSRLVKNEELAIEFYRYISDVEFSYAMKFLKRFSKWEKEIVPAAQMRFSYPEASPTSPQSKTSVRSYEN